MHVIKNVVHVSSHSLITDYKGAMNCLRKFIIRTKIYMYDLIEETTLIDKEILWQA